MKNRPGQIGIRARILGILTSLLFKVFSLTFRYRFHLLGAHSLAVYQFTKNVQIDPKSNYLYALWDQEKLGVLFYFRNQQITAVVSLSKWGNFMSVILQFFGYRTVRGSSSEGAIRALLGAIKELKKGYSIVASLDGPKGPRFEMKKGIVKMSEKTQTPIVPIRAYFSLYYTVEPSWSKLRIPLPFSKIDIYIGEPKMYSEEELKQALAEIGKKAFANLGEVAAN